jgi:hypothetical protein
LTDEHMATSPVAASEEIIVAVVGYGERSFSEHGFYA